jgi:hypothetical protein
MHGTDEARRARWGALRGREGADTVAIRGDEPARPRGDTISVAWLKAQSERRRLRSPQVTRAMAESHSRHVRMERLLREAGLASEETQAPEYLPMLEAGLESALRRPREKSR